MTATRTPAPSTVQLPSYVRHEDRDVELVLTAAWLGLEFALDGHSLASPVLSPLPVGEAHEGLNRISVELERAAAVEACTLHSEFTYLTDLESHGPSLAEDVGEHADIIRGDARVQAEQLVQRANAARWVTP